MLNIHPKHPDRLIQSNIGKTLSPPPGAWWLDLTHLGLLVAIVVQWDSRPALISSLLSVGSQCLMFMLKAFFPHPTLLSCFVAWPLQSPWTKCSLLPFLLSENALILKIVHILG